MIQLVRIEEKLFVLACIEEMANLESAQADSTPWWGVSFQQDFIEENCAPFMRW